MMKRSNKIPREKKSDSRSGKENHHNLVLFNDEINEFSYVIESLVEVCNHDSLQAEQCTYLAHYRGKCEIKSGSYDELKVMKDALIERGLRAEVH